MPAAPLLDRMFDDGERRYLASARVGHLATADAEGRPHVVATGTRGRDGEHSFLLGSVAERVVRTCPVPVLTVRQLEAGG